MSCTTSTIEPDFELEFDLPIPVSPAIAEWAGRRVWLARRHRDELLASDISEEMITASGIRTVFGADVCQMRRWGQDGSNVGYGWAIPFDDPDAENCYWRVKPDESRRRGDHTVKYESPVGSSNRAYRPPGFDDSKGKLIVITEGEKKTLCAISHGINCLGLTGVWNWQKRRKRDDNDRAYGSRQLIDDLAAIHWANREVIIAFDSDAVEKRGVELAQQRLAEKLAKHGAKVKVARLPGGKDDRKLGLDDAIMELGVDAVRDILDAAQKPELPKLSWPDLARMLINECFSRYGETTIRYWRHSFWRWANNHYDEVDDKSIQIEAYRFLEQIHWRSNRNAAAEVLTALQAEVAIDARTEPPLFVEPRSWEPPGTPLFFDDRTAFLDFDEQVLRSPLPTMDRHPGWFCTGSRSFPYEPYATCPTWDRLLESSLPDPVARRLLQQWFGYLISGRMHHHKILLLNGAGRAGKSIIRETMSQLVGSSVTATTTLKEMGGQFGLSQLVGKQLLLVPDTQDRGSCLGAVERLKAISGCDSLDINRKHKPILTNIRLQTRIVITSNQLPRFLDPTGGLFSRLLIVYFPISFKGREDETIPPGVRAELPGVFNWAYEGWLDLRVTGFVEPPSSADALARAERVMSPIKAFLDDYCQIGTGEKVLVDSIWCAWQKWCKDTGHHSGNKEKLGNDLSGALPEVQRRQLRCGGQRAYFYVGVTLNDAGGALLQEWKRQAYRLA